MLAMTRRNSVFYQWYLSVTSTCTRSSLADGGAVDISSLGLDEHAWFGVLDYLGGPSLHRVKLVSEGLGQEALNTMRSSERTTNYQYYIASKFAKYVDSITTARAIREGIPVCVLGHADGEESEYGNIRFFVRIAFARCPHSDSGDPLPRYHDLAVQGWYQMTATGQGLSLEACGTEYDDDVSKHLREFLETQLDNQCDTPEDRMLHLSILMNMFNVTIVAVDQRTFIPSVVFKMDKRIGDTWGGKWRKVQNAYSRFKRSVQTNDCYHSYFGAMKLQSDNNGSLRLRSGAFKGWPNRWLGRDLPLTRHAEFRITPTGWSLLVHNGNE